MPIKGARYRVVTRNGKKVRLAFKGNEVVEAKNLETGAMHTRDEFERDKRKQEKRKKRRKK